MADHARVIAVCSRPKSGIGKDVQEKIELIEGHGVEGDAHAGVKVKHRSRAAKFPEMPNLRQVHLIHAELHDELRANGFDVRPGAMGENITTRGLDLLGMKRGTRLRLGQTAVIEVTGLRNPCMQLDEIQPGLMQATLEKLPNGQVLRKTGVMAIVIIGGAVRAGDTIHVEVPADAAEALEPV